VKWNPPCRQARMVSARVVVCRKRSYENPGEEEQNALKEGEKSTFVRVGE